MLGFCQILDLHLTVTIKSTLVRIYLEISKLKAKHSTHALKQMPRTIRKKKRDIKQFSVLMCLQGSAKQSTKVFIADGAKSDYECTHDKTT